MFCICACTLHAIGHSLPHTHSVFLPGFRVYLVSSYTPKPQGVRCTCMHTDKNISGRFQMLRLLFKLLTLGCCADTHWSSQDLSLCCWALARLNTGNRKLLDLIYNRILVDIPVFSAKEISYQLWGFAALGYPLRTSVIEVYLVSTSDRLSVVPIVWHIFSRRSIQVPGSLRQSISCAKMMGKPTHL